MQLLFLCSVKMACVDVEISLIGNSVIVQFQNFTYITTQILKVIIKSARTKIKNTPGNQMKVRGTGQY